jgi:hypothetical protein
MVTVADAAPRKTLVKTSRVKSEGPLAPKTATTSWLMFPFDGTRSTFCCVAEVLLNSKSKGPGWEDDVDANRRMPGFVEVTVI